MGSLSLSFPYGKERKSFPDGKVSPARGRVSVSPYGRDLLCLSRTGKSDILSRMGGTCSVFPVRERLELFPGRERQSKSLPYGRDGGSSSRTGKSLLCLSRTGKSVSLPVGRDRSLLYPPRNDLGSLNYVLLAARRAFHNLRRVSTRPWRYLRPCVVPYFYTGWTSPGALLPRFCQRAQDVHQHLPGLPRFGFGLPPGRGLGRDALSVPGWSCLDRCV